MRLALAANAALCAALAAAAPAPLCSVGHYRIIELPLQPVAINDQGLVLGTTEDHRAALWEQHSGLRRAPLPRGFTHSAGISLNTHGDFIATAFDAGFTHWQAYLVSRGRIWLLGGQKARAFQLSDQNLVAGEALLPGATRTAPVLWSLGGGESSTLTPQPLSTCCGGTAKRVDEQGRTMGDAYDQQGHYYAFLGSGSGALERLDQADRFSTVVAMNHGGHAILEAFPRLLLYADGALTPLVVPRGPPAHPRALNDCDVAVGQIGANVDVARAFAWERHGGFVDLNQRIDANSGWKLRVAEAINDRDEIVGRGDPPGALDQGFLLRPQRPD